MKEKKISLEAAGWTCNLCSCPNRKGWDCGSKDKRGYIIKLRDNGFKILKKGLVIEDGHLYQLEKKMQLHGLL